MAPETVPEAYPPSPFVTIHSRLSRTSREVCAGSQFIVRTTVGPWSLVIGSGGLRAATTFWFTPRAFLGNETQDHGGFGRDYPLLLWCQSDVAGSPVTGRLTCPKCLP